MVRLQYTKKKVAGPVKAGYQSCIKLWPIAEHAKKVFWHHDILHQHISLENSLAVTMNHTQLLQYLHTKEPSLLRASDWRWWWFSKELLYGILSIHSVQHKSIGLKFSKSQTGSHVTYSCHHNLSHFTFPIFAHSWSFSVFHSLQSITPRIY